MQKKKKIWHWDVQKKNIGEGVKHIDVLFSCTYKQEIIWFSFPGKN